MNTIGLSRPSPDRTLDVHLPIWSKGASEKDHSCVIVIDRYALLGGGCSIDFYRSYEDLLEGSSVTLDFVDKASFRAAYRYARVWRSGGIGHKGLGEPGGAA